MTTKAAEALYLAQHQFECQGRRTVIHNPHNKPIQELPVIYGFNNGGSPGWFQAIALAEDGVVVGGHCCSHEGYMPHDLGVIEGGFDKHEAYRAHYPDGYRMEFVPSDQKEGHEGWRRAVDLCKERGRESSEKGD